MCDLEIESCNLNCFKEDIFLKIWSFCFNLKDGFRMDDIKYKWGDGANTSALDISPNIELPQFKYKDYKLIERQFRLSTGL